jgi:hypothetical protein
VRAVCEACLQVSGWTPLHAACKKGHVAVVRTLVDGRKVDVNLAAVRVTIFWYYLVEPSRFVSSPTECPWSLQANMWTPLYIACRKGHADVVGILLDNGACHLTDVRQLSLTRCSMLCWGLAGVMACICCFFYGW